ncbi:hypothetical protein BH11CYA1_BH11CYA1_01360 [soil metagenome]
MLPLSVKMYRPKVDPNTLPLRLPRLESLPTSKDVSEALQHAQKSVGRRVEIIWARPGADSSLTLTCTYSALGGEPVWELTENRQREIKEIWTYPCGDIGLILNLVTAECTGDALPLGDSSQLGSGIDKGTSNSSGVFSSTLLRMQSISTQRAPVANASRNSKVATMEGSLTDMQVPNLLQSISMGGMTGCLFVDNGEAAAELYFQDGTLTHGKALDIEGDQAILELVTWESGKFYFYRDETSPQRTIVKRIDALLMEGIALLDQTKAIAYAGVRVDSYIDKAEDNLSEKDFEQRVSTGAPVDMGIQKNFYIQLDGCATLSDILHKTPMAKKDWVPVVFNLVSSKLIKASNKPAKTDKTAGLHATPIDTVAIERVNKMLARPDTSILSYPSFHYFLQQEFDRFQQYRIPYSVIIFEMWAWHNNELKALSPTALQEAVTRINGAKRSLDLFAHFEALSYAILLPHTETPAAAVLAHRILEILRARTLGPEASLGQLALAFGVAGIPEDCQDIGIMLAAAKASKVVAQKNNYPIVMFKDITPPA